MVLYIFLIVNSSLVSYNTQHVMFSLSVRNNMSMAIEYRQIKNNTLRFSQVDISTIIKKDFKIVVSEVALQSK